MGSATGYDRLTCEIRVKKTTGDLIKFYSCVAIEIETSFNTLTDTATVTLPYDNRWIKRDTNGFNRVQMISGNDEGFFSVEDEIEIYFGYNFKNNLEFEGYIVGIGPKTPLKLICEDKMHKLKKNKLMFSTRPNVKLTEILYKLIAGTGVEVHPQTFEQDIIFGKLQVPNWSTAKLLDDWREKGIKSFMKEGKLIIGRSHFSDSSSIYSSTKIKGYIPPTFNTQSNIIEDDLQLNVVSSDGIAIKAVSMFTSNKTLEITVVLDPNDPAKLMVVEERDERLSKDVNEANQKALAATMEAKGIFIENFTIKTHHETNQNRAQLLETAKAVFPNHIKTGMEGSFTTFGDYSLKPATSIFLLDTLTPDKNGEYLIRDIHKTFGGGGIRQKVSIPYKIRNLDRKK